MCSAYTTCVIVTSDSGGAVARKNWKTRLVWKRGRCTHQWTPSGIHSVEQSAYRAASGLAPLRHEAQILHSEIIQGSAGSPANWRRVTPIHLAIVAAYCSTDVVGINRPLPASVEALDVRSGNAP